SNGKRFSRKPGGRTRARRLSCSPAPRAQDAGLPSPPRVRSIVQTIGRSISTPHFFRISSAASVAAMLEAKLPILPGLRDHARDWSSRAEFARNPAPGAGSAAQHGLGGKQSTPGSGRVAGRLPCWVWAHHAEEKWRFIEPGDVEAAMQTASAIGDDRL